MSYKCIAGVDLAGIETNPTGVCLLDGREVRTFLPYTDNQIIDLLVGSSPVIIAIDAPLALPVGRKIKNGEIVGDRLKHFRSCDGELLKLHIRFFPITLGGMRKLTIRGIILKRKLERIGFCVIETYPGAAYDIWGIPRKNTNLLIKFFKEKFKLKGDVEKKGITIDELDSITCALVGKLYLQRKTISIGNPQEALMILPKDTKLPPY